MSINEPIILKYNQRRQQYYFAQGNETFYDVENKWIEFDTIEDALTFGLEIFGKFKVADDLPPDTHRCKCQLVKDDVGPRPPVQVPLF